MFTIPPSVFPATCYSDRVNSKGFLILKPEFMLADMIHIQSLAFRTTLDKSGRPYIEHLLKVMYLLRADDDPELKCIGCAHDYFEDIFNGDCERGGATLLERGHSDRVVVGISDLTKVPDEPYKVYQLKVMGNKDAIQVKIKDIRHNSDLRRIKGVSQKDFDRHVRYMAFYYLLVDKAKQLNLPI